MKLRFLPFLFLMSISVAASASDEAIEIDSEKEILRELEQIHTMGSGQWSRKLEEARMNSKEFQDSTETLPVHLTESL